MSATATSVAYLGPAGTFTEEALLGQPDYATAKLEARDMIDDVLESVAAGGADLGFVPIENAIEGTVNATLDGLVFDYDLLIQREVVADIHLHLMGPAGTVLSDIRRVVSIPMALGQCRRFLAERCRGAAHVAASSTAEAARLVGEQLEPGVAAIAPRLAADLYGLEVIAEEVEDHPGNQTRFVSVGRQGVPAPTGHDRTSIVCFQRSDRPGNLHGILGQFAARNINLTKVESRPTKRGLGDYCFVIDAVGHLGDEVVADCLRDLHAELGRVKFLGSYPAAGEQGDHRRRQANRAWKSADRWLRSLRAQIP